jgi:hypothetical protein
MERFVTLIISDEPVKLPKKVRETARHCIQEQVNVKFDRGYGEIVQSLSDGTSRLAHGTGQCESGVICDWLRNICASRSYIPQYRLREKSREEKSKKKRKTGK